MNSAYISAIAALVGSAIGALASLATTWLSQHGQERAARLAQEMSRRESLYGAFIEEASRVLADALTHHVDEPSKLVHLYALLGKLRLFASANVLARAQEVMEKILEIHHLLESDFHKIEDKSSIDILREFAEACRNDLQHYTRRDMPTGR